MEIRMARKEDLECLKQIWKRCFGDEDRYIDFYFDNRIWTEEMAVLLVDDTIVSMLAMIPADFITAEGETDKTAMIYAVATHPDFRKRGLAEKLMEYSNRYLITKEIPSTMLVPAGEELFDFYRKRGYKETFFIRQIKLTRDEVANLADSALIRCVIDSAEPNQYNEVRRKCLKGHYFIDYRTQEIAFQKKESQLYGVDIYTIKVERVLNEKLNAMKLGGFSETSDTIGCAAIERTADTVLIKEFLIPEEYLISALKQIVTHMPCEKYIVRTPAFSGETLRGSIRSFGMLRVNTDFGDKIEEPCGTCRTDLEHPNTTGLNNMLAYLGIAYD